MKSILMKTRLGMMILGTLALAATGAQAGWNPDTYGHDGHAYQQSRMHAQLIEARQARQMERIRSGMHSGRLTRAEFRELMHEQRAIRKMERHFRADGAIDGREFRHLERALDLASRNIRAEKHDRQERYAYQRGPRFN